MASWTFYLVTFVVSLIVYLFLRRDKKNIPKGPWAWPVVGNGPDMRPFIHTAMAKWAKQYGDVYTMYFGPYRTIVLSDPMLVREAFGDAALTGRPDSEMFTILSGPHGIVVSEGQEWIEQRRFTLRNLRDFGFGKNSGVELITNEMREFIQSLATNVGHPVSINRSFTVALLNTLWMIISGVRYEQDDPRLWSILKQSEEAGKKMGSNPLIMIAPHIAKLAPKLTGWNEVMDLVQKVRNVIAEPINRHLEDKPEDGNPRDFIDAYLKEIEATTDPASSFYKDAGLRSLTAVVGDLFSGGTETSSATLSWIILYLVKFPKIQEKLHQELDEVVGKSRSPSLIDRPDLPYAEAVIAEAMRMSSVVPFGVFHKAMKDIKFHGYDIPKGTWVSSNTHFIHNDPRIWEKPEEFKPERFLTADGKAFKKHDAFMPFSTGKRQCIGETLARDTVFLYSTNIFHRFSIRLAPESADASLEPAPGFFLNPQDFKVILQDRM